MERRLRIGELAERTRVSTDVLRAWERRYGLLRPRRSDGGYRLYGSDDEQRVLTMTRHIEAGVPAGEAARLVLEGADAPEVEGPVVAGLSDELRDALDKFDDGRAQAALDGLIATLSFETIAREVVLPYLRELGERWERGEASVAQEHFASMVLRGRLLALARGWDRGGGPRALLACAPEEQHELGLIVFGLALREHGWRITYLGADTPVDTLEAATRELSPVALVLIALSSDKLRGLAKPLAELARHTRLLLGGGGARETFATKIGAEVLRGDPVEAAAALASRTPLTQS